MDASPADQPDDSEEDLLVKLTSLVVLGAGLLALFFGYDWFWIVFAVGFAVLVPIVKLVTDELGTAVGAEESRYRYDERDDSNSESKQDALDALRDRYARGELSEADFERKVETLLETETLEGARDRVRRESGAEIGTETRVATERETRFDAGRETSPETERETDSDTESATERR